MSESNQIMQRGDIFKLLAVCFCEPDKNLLQEENLCANLSDLFQDIAPDIVPAAREMVSALGAQEQEQLSIDHAMLFVGPFELLAPPYGSVWLEEKRRVMGDSTMAVLKYYQDAGLVIDINEPPDHIAVELEFMYFLCSQEAGARVKERSDEAEYYFTLQSGFFRTMLEPWVDDFCKAIEDNSQSTFYRALAMTLVSYTGTLRHYYRTGV